MLTSKFSSIGGLPYLTNFYFHDPKIELKIPYFNSFNRKIEFCKNDKFLPCQPQK